MYRLGTGQAPAIGALQSPTMWADERMGRPAVGGKFLFVAGEKFWIRGVTYGAFRPDSDGHEYHDLDIVERDFAQMAAGGFNAVRIPHTMPPRALLDIAARHGLRVTITPL
jgi:beta-galactosidase/beta-glucuronidase